MSALQKYLDAASKSHEAFGEEVGCSGVHICRIANGDKRISLGLALKILRASGVAVGPLAGKSKQDIATLERAHQLTSAA